MALSTSNVNTTTDSFQNWIDKTNVLLDAYSTTIITTAANASGGFTTGNGTVNGIFTANSISVDGNSSFGLRGGNVTTNATLYVTSNISVAGITTLVGNSNLSGALQTISGNANFDSGVLFVDATNNRVGINNTAPTVALEVTGAANVSTSVNSSLFTVGTNLAANASGVHHSGYMNAASFVTTGGGIVANTTAITPTSNTILLGNTVGRFVLSANTGDFSGAVTVSGNATLSGQLQTISGNVDIDSGTLFVDAATDSVKVKNLSTNTGSIYISNGALSGVTVMSIANGSIGSNITSAQTVASFTKTLYPTGQLTITASNTTHKQVEHLIFAHNDTDVQTTVFGRVAAPATANLGIANVVINGVNLEINFSQAAINTKINILANLFTP